METKSKKSIIDEAKIELEELEDLLKKNGEEFKTSYNEKKARLTKLIKKYTEELEVLGEKKLHDIKENSEELLDLLEADYDLSYSEYENESHKISKALEKFEAVAREKFAAMSADVREAKSKLDAELSSNFAKFKTEMDIQKAHFKGTGERAMSEFESWKNSRLNDIETLKKELENKKMETEVKFEKFSEEISESVSHLKKAFKNLW